MQQTDIKTRPILFSAPMVRAILEGSKTQTRRVIKPQPTDEYFREALEKLGKPIDTPFIPHLVDVMDPLLVLGAKVDSATGFGLPNIKCPYGKPGDRLYVRETWAPAHQYTGWPFIYRATAKEDGTPEDGRWKPSIHMPRVASRIILEITNVWVERLNEISEDDSIAEGIQRLGRGWKAYGYELDMKPISVQNPVTSYCHLWQSINGQGSWDLNPWVWAINFKKV